MMKKLSTFSVNYPITVLMLVMAIILLGYISFQKLGIDLLPELNNPRIFIELKSGERPPVEMEDLFVKNVEAIAIRQKNVTEVSSVSRVGSAQITVEYSWDADMDESYLDLQKNLTNFSQNSELDELTMSQHDPNSAPVMLIGLSHPEITDMDELRKIADNYLRNELTRLEGIAAVDIIGAEEKELTVQTSPYLLKAHGLTLAEVAAKIQNSNRTVSGGSIEELGLKFIIKGVGEFQSVEDIGNVILTQKQSENTNPGEPAELVPVYLKDIADLTFRNKDPENIVRINQQRCVALAVYKETKFNTIRAVETLRDGLQQLQKALPGYHFAIVQDQSEFIRTAVDEVRETALYGILLAILVLFIFLRRLGTTLIISIAIPISVIATFNLMYFNGLTLNIMTLGGLALGAGMLVDNAIVVVENIYRNMEKGMSIREAAINGTAEVAGAITASTITTIVVFLPIVYLHGASGELFKDQAWTVAFSLISSLVVAILVIPMLSHKFLKPASQPQEVIAVRFGWYRSLLSSVLDRRRMVVLSTFVMVIVTFLLIPFIGSEFIPKGEVKSFSMEISLPEGSTLAHTDRVAMQLEAVIGEVVGTDLQTLYTRVGPIQQSLTEQTDTFLKDEHTAVIEVFLVPEPSRPLKKIIDRLDGITKAIPEIEVQFVQEQTSLQSTLGTDQAPVMVEIKGDNLETIRDLTEQAKTRMGSVNDIFDIEASFDEGRPEINVMIDRVRAGIRNLEFSSIGSQLSDYLQGKNAGDWDSEGEMRDITINMPNIQVKQLSELYVQNSRGEDVRLDEIASFEQTNALRQINRRNQSRIGLITAQIRGETPLDKIASQIESQLAGIHFPEGYQYNVTGEEQKRAESFASLKFALLLSIVLIYMVL
ncbi:MAG: efflux RND transporter permease subunit, partial [Calditrichales bacterium]